MSTIDEIKARLDIVELISETVKLRRSGKSYTGFCPFHPNSRTPAFVVFPDSGTWRCFGQCNEGGDIFKFVMKKEGWDFSEALRYLADRAGIQLKPSTPEQQAQSEENDHLRALLEEAVLFYRHHLVNTPDGVNALNYLRNKRSLSDATLETFGIGYAPHSYEATLRYFQSKGHSPEDLLASGMVSQREDGAESARFYDRFRNRIMIPIRDERGRMAGFGARILSPEDIPKFLNSPQTPIFDKGHLLYGLDRARKTIRARDQVVIVEGYLDVIALHQGGYTNVVSPMGTALTEQQLGLLKRLTRHIVLALDPDAAGNQATLRGLQLARETLDREQEVTFDARGLISSEARLQADIRVTTLPAGMDPDEVVNRNPKEWEQIVAEARPVVVHVMEVLAAGRNLEDAKVKTEIAGQVMPLIADVPDPVERDTYRQRLARLLRISEQSLVETRPGTGYRRRTQPSARGTPAAVPGTERSRPGAPGMDSAQSSEGSPAAPPANMPSGYTQEAHCLGMFLRYPALLYRVDRKLQEAGLSRLTPDDFLHTDHQAIFNLLQESIDQDMAEPINFVLSGFSLPMMEVADDLLLRTTTSAQVDPNEDRLLEDLLRGLLDLRQRNLRQQSEYLRYLIEDAQEQGLPTGDPKMVQYHQSMVQIIQVKKKLDQAIGRYTSRLSVRTGGSGSTEKGN